VAFTQTGGPVNGPDSGVKCFSCGGPHYASRCPKTTQEQKDELYSPEAKAKRNELHTKKGVNQLTTDVKEAAKPAAAAAAAPAKAESTASSASLRSLGLGSVSAARLKQAFKLLCGALVAAFPEQMTGVSLFAKAQSGKKVSFGESVAEQDSVSDRVTLNDWKLYLDTWATYHSAFVD